MARTKYWQFLINEEGQPISDAEIYLYLAGSTTGANLYDTETGGTTFTSIEGAANITTDSDGYFEFFIGGPDDANGYAFTQKFKLAWKKAGIAENNIDELNMIDMAAVIAEVDETSSDTTKNKLTSNYLEKLSTDHISYVLPDTDGPHNIQPVDETDTDNVKNKTVSNYIINTLFALALSAAAPAPSGNVTYYSQTVNPSGIPSGNVWSWEASSSNYKADISHWLSNEWPLVQVWKYNEKQVYQPTKIRSVTQHVSRIWVDDDIKSRVTIVG